MKLKYIPMIKAAITIPATKKTSNILDGTYKSIYKGRSMNFEDLREYVIGDNIKDIDWKATARSGTILIRQYIAEKKHNIMLVFDTGKKMQGETPEITQKKDIAIMSAGILAYLANKNGDYVGSIYTKNNEPKYFPFKYGLENIERILTNYEADASIDNTTSLNNTVSYLCKYIKKRMIVIIITDIDGMQEINSKTLKLVTSLHDVLFININDAYMTNGSYDIENNIYIPNLILNDSKLQDLEKKMRKDMYSKCLRKLKKHGISITTINNINEVPIKIIELLERHKYANIH